MSVLNRLNAYKLSFCKFFTGGVSAAKDFGISPASVVALISILYCFNTLIFNFLILLTINQLIKIESELQNSNITIFTTILGFDF